MEYIMSFNRAGLLSLLGAIVLAGCNDDDPARTTFGAPLSRGQLFFTANGGAGTGSSASHGGGAGTIKSLCRGNVYIGQNPAPQPPPIPAAPVTGVAVGSWSNTQTIAHGNAFINSDITVGSSGSVATLNVSSGDLVINASLTTLGTLNLFINVMAGTLYLHGSIRTGRSTAALDGEGGGNVTVNALRIVFTGSIDTRGEANASGNGGYGGSVNFVTDYPGVAASLGQTSQILVGGKIDMEGGDAFGNGVTGGGGGNYKSSKDKNADGSAHISGAADGTVYVSGTVFNQNGGSATGTGKVTGGGAGYTYWLGNGGFFFDGTHTGIGGNATSSNGEAFGGSGTGMFWQEFTIGDSGAIALFGSMNLSGGSASAGPSSQGAGGQSGFIELYGSMDQNYGGGLLSMRGGDSSGRGGEGGIINFLIPDGVPGDIFIHTDTDLSSGSGPGATTTATAGFMTLATDLGDIQIDGTHVFNGGNGSGASPTSGPSSGGRVKIRTGDGDSTDGGSIVLFGTLQANGGSDSVTSNDTHGGAGGLVEIICDNPWGSIYLDPGSSIQLDGGAPGGSGAARGGPGGILKLKTTGGIASTKTAGGNISMRGTIRARGGPGGGAGGVVDAQSDCALVTGGLGDGRGGDIMLGSEGTIDVSGGEGGGDAVNDGLQGATIDLTAVCFDADSRNSNNTSENGVVRNLGTIAARGGSPDGNGGDVRFDGLNGSLTNGPAPGSLDIMGTGSGINGGYRSD
jgi:hypothetical protein